MTIEDALASHALASALATPLASFVTLFESWNQRINLSSARTRDAVDDHVIDSLAVVPHLRDAKRVLDVGSGGGFPVVVAAICRPDIDFVALEPVHKKHAFLRTAARELALPNLDALAQRLEDHPGRDYDLAMSRATFDLETWFGKAARFVRPGGIIIGFEGIQTNLSVPVERYPYPLRDRTRAILVRRM
jgi:16S rRNA (guanine527-N7)-methyltransferase